MKLINVLDFVEVYEGFKDEKMPFKLAYKLSKLMTSVQHEVEFYKKKLNEILEEFAERDSNGQYQVNESGIRIKVEKKEECARRINELQSLEVDIPANLTVDELDFLSLTPTQTQKVIPFIAE